MLDPVLLQTPHDDTDFDLDVRLQAVAHHVSVELAKPPTQLPDCGGTMGNCPTGVTSCSQCRQLQD
jgi:hypothetical protein